MLKKIEIGDVFEIETRKGKGFLVFVKKPKDNTEAEMIKVFYNLNDKTPDNLEELISKDGFFICFPLKAAWRRNIVKKVGTVILNEDCKPPILMRTENPFGEGWNIVNIELDEYTFVGIKVLTEVQIKYSPDGVWNDTLLIENLENGWRLENWK